MGTSILQALTRQFDLQKINTATKYPSILTYHNLGDKGRLLDTLTEGLSFNGHQIYVTEKVDGSNGRIVMTTNREGFVNDYFIGSREDLLYARGDRILNPSLNMVEVLKPVADTILLLSCCPEYRLRPNSVYVLYGENYGGKINAHKQYTQHGAKGARFFDLTCMSYEDFSSLLERDVAAIASWRDHGGQSFVPVDDLQHFCKNMCLDTVPYLQVMDGNNLPTELADTLLWMHAFKNTCAALDDDYAGPGNAEGVVVRTADRKLIRKLRFEDYVRTLRDKNH